MKKLTLIVMVFLFTFCSSSNQENTLSKKNLKTAQSFLDNIITNPVNAKGSQGTYCYSLVC